MEMVPVLGTMREVPETRLQPWEISLEIVTASWSCFGHHPKEEWNYHQYHWNPVTILAKDFDSRQVRKDCPLGKDTGVLSRKPS